ncbi:hypothetical protein Gohar_021121, partial [Gossypium harknessii]|nr:hypothetical protein [Gossypium harknessii]
MGDLSNLETLGLAYNGFSGMEKPWEFSFLKKWVYLWMTITNLI